MKNINEEVVKNLIKQGLSISTMESCTGGLCCSFLTDVQGSSSVVKGGYITYTNEQKIKAGVDENIIKHFGVYSKECSVDMALKTKQNTDANIGVGITGTLANVDENNKDSVKGIVYYTIIINNKILSRELIFNEKDLSLSRFEQKEKVVKSILDFLYENLLH